MRNSVDRVLAVGQCLLALSISASAWADPGDACKASLESDLAPFREKVRSIWVDDRLYAYVEVAKLLSKLMDEDPRVRPALEDLRMGKGSASELYKLLSEKAELTCGYADSLANKYGKAFYWHYPVIHVEDIGARRVYLTLPVGVGSYELRADLGGSSSAESARVLASAASIIGARAGIGLPHKGLAGSYDSERSYVSRYESPVPAECRSNPEIRAGLDLRLPEDKGVALADRISSRGRAEGAAIMGFPMSDYVPGPKGNSGGGSEPAHHVESGGSQPGAGGQGAPPANPEPTNP